jgi:hypothetical protein
MGYALSRMIKIIFDMDIIHFVVNFKNQSGASCLLSILIIPENVYTEDSTIGYAIFCSALSMYLF